MIMKNRTTIVDIISYKNNRQIVALTAYHAQFAVIADKYADIILVGDSMGMVLYNMESTIGVSLEMMAAHTKAVATSTKKALIIADLPFGTYQESPSQAMRSAGVLLNSGAGAVKLEGGLPMVDTIRFLTDRGIPVMAHIGLMPQSVNIHGGYSKQGKNEASKKQIISDAYNVAEAGAFSIVVECVEESIVADITQNISVPIIGIGAGKNCDGQILVTEDLAGLTPKTPSFVKRYAELGQALDSAIAEYAKDIRA